MAIRIFVAAMLAALSPMFSVGAQAAELRQIRNFGPNPGNLKMYLYAPTNLAPGAPVVVVGRGCIQTVQELADHSGWPEVADRYGFALIAPDTSKINEPFANCFRTWLPTHQSRGAGEPLSVRNMVRWAVRNLRSDRKRVFIAGVSSGGMLANVMLATYPDVFAAGAIAAGTPYRCSNRFEDVAPCATGIITHSRERWARFVRVAYPGFRGCGPGFRSGMARPTRSSARVMPSMKFCNGRLSCELAQTPQRPAKWRALSIRFLPHATARRGSSCFASGAWVTHGR